MASMMMITRGEGCGGGIETRRSSKSTANEEEDQNQQLQQLSLLDFCLAALRKSIVACKVDSREEIIYDVQNMEIGWPTNLQHIAHVTFDRFEGFLGLPVELKSKLIVELHKILIEKDLLFLDFFLAVNPDLFNFLGDLGGGGRG